MLPVWLENFHQDHNNTSNGLRINKHSRNKFTALNNIVDDVRCNGSIPGYDCVSHYVIRYRRQSFKLFHAQLN